MRLTVLSRYPVKSHAKWVPTASLENSKGMIREFYQQARLEKLDCKKGETVILKEAFDDGFLL